MRSPVEVAIVGLGSIGGAVVREAAALDDLVITAAVDIDPSMSGRDAGECCGLERIGLPIAAELQTALRESSPDVVMIATGSHVEAVAPLVISALAAGAHAVSSCEELAWPWRTSPDLSAEIDSAARAVGRSVIGVGVNPGFVQDLLVLAVGGASRNIRAVSGIRKVDLSTRRAPLLAKMGVGLTADEFVSERSAGRLGHIGLEQSLDLVAAGLGWEVDDLVIEDGSLIAETDLRAGPNLIGEGLVRGMWMRGIALSAGREIRLELEMGVGTLPEDRIEVNGQPPVKVVIEGGLSGDEATVSRMVNAIDLVVSARPGLLSVLDLPIVPKAGHTA